MIYRCIISMRSNAGCPPPLPRCCPRPKADLSVHNFYALEGGLPAAPTTLLPDDTTTLWTQTIGAVAPTYSQFQTGLQAQGAVHPELSQSNSNVSAKAGVDWKPTDDVLTYFLLRQGFSGRA